MHNTLTRLTSLTAALTLALFAGSATLNAQAAAKPLSVTDLVAAIDANVGKQIVVEGMATWVCPHMGCKAQIINADGESKTALLLTQGKGTPKFNPELRGDTLRVTGILHETRITAADLDEQEAAIKNPKNADAHDHDHGHGKGDDCENCPSKQQKVSPEQLAKAKNAQLARIAKHREMLSKSKKGYLSSLSFESKSWEKVD